MYRYIYMCIYILCCTTDEDRRYGRKFWTLCIFYWIMVFFKLLFAVSFSTYMCIYMHAYICIYIENMYIVDHDSSLQWS